MDAATAIASALSTQVSTPVSPVSGSNPAKTIEQRSKLYKQLEELGNLHKTGILTEQEYQAEKQSML